MKEIKLENGTSINIKNQYNFNILANKINNHFFLNISNEKYGPFARLFLSKHDDGDFVIIGYFPKESHIIRVGKKGIDISRRNITSTSQLKEYDTPLAKNDEHFLGMVNNYSIYFKDDYFFALSNEEEASPLKFADYEELVDYYKSKNISLYNQGIANQAAKLKRVFIKFDNFYEFINSVKASDLPEEIQLDIALDRTSFKPFFMLTRKECIKSVKSDEEASNLLRNGYVEFPYRSIEKFKSAFPLQYEKLNELISNKAISLKEECVCYLKEKDNINFDNLYNAISQVKISDLTDASRKEISAKRPLTPTIFSGVIGACIDKLKEQGIHIREDYKITKVLRTMYPNESQILWELINNRLQDLYNEYVEYQKEKFNKMIRKQ